MSRLFLELCMQRQISFGPLVPMRRKPDPYQFLVSLTMVFSVDMFRWIRIGLDFQQMRFKRLQKVLCVIRQRCSWQRTKLDLICGAMKYQNIEALNREILVAGCRVSVAEARELRAVPRHSHLRGKDGQRERKHAGASAGGF